MYRFHQSVGFELNVFAEKTINDEEVSNVDIAESMAELKVTLGTIFNVRAMLIGSHIEQT